MRASGTARTPAVIDTLAGVPVATFHDATGAAQFATLFDFVPGRMLDETNAEAAFVELGETAARRHGFNETWPRPTGFVRPEWDIETAMGRQGCWGYRGDNATVGPVERDLLARGDAKIRAEIGAYGRPPARYGLIHGDMRMANFIVDPGGIQLSDFDDCGISWHLYGLACALTFVEHAPETPALVAAWLRGYTRLRPLDAANLAVLPAMVMLRRMLLVGWFHTHAHVTELHDLSQRYVPQTMEIGAAFLRGAYLALGGGA